MAVTVAASLLDQLKIQTQCTNHSAHMLSFSDSSPTHSDPLFKDLHGLPFGELEPRDMAGKTRETPKMMCDPADFAAVADKRNTQVCVGVRTRTATSTFDVYETTDDPASPFYYTTCYLPAKHIQFDNLPPPADKVITNWREPHSSVCMDCKVRAETNQRCESQLVFCRMLRTTRG